MGSLGSLGGIARGFNRYDDILRADEVRQGAADDKAAEAADKQAYSQAISAYAQALSIGDEVGAERAFQNVLRLPRVDPNLAARTLKMLKEQYQQTVPETTPTATPGPNQLMDMSQKGIEWDAHAAERGDPNPYREDPYKGPAPPGTDPGKVYGPQGDPSYAQPDPRIVAGPGGSRQVVDLASQGLGVIPGTTPDKPRKPPKPIQPWIAGNSHYDRALKAVRDEYDWAFKREASLGGGYKPEATDWPAYRDEGMAKAQAAYTENMTSYNKSLADAENGAGVDAPPPPGADPKWKSNVEQGKARVQRGLDPAAVAQSAVRRGIIQASELDKFIREISQ